MILCVLEGIQIKALELLRETSLHVWPPAVSVRVMYIAKTDWNLQNVWPCS